LAEAIIFNLHPPEAPMDNDFAEDKIYSGNPAMFEDVFKAHFKGLHAYACSVIKNESAAEEIVQNVFFKLWERKASIQIEQSVTAYLYRSVYNESLNYVRHHKVRASYHQHATRNGSEETTSDPAAVRELQNRIDKTINELPEQCRTIFQMSRYEDLKYRTIADRLGISVKTVENQMGKALKILRSKLIDYLPTLVLLFINIKIIML